MTDSDTTSTHSAMISMMMDIAKAGSKSWMSMPGLHLKVNLTSMESLARESKSLRSTSKLISTQVKQAIRGSSSSTRELIGRKTLSGQVLGKMPNQTSFKILIQPASLQLMSSTEKRKTPM